MAGGELPLQAVRMQIASGLDIIVHLGRLRDRSRRVLEIAEVLGYEEGEVKLRSLYRFEEKKPGEGAGMEERPGAAGQNTKRVEGALRKVGELVHREKLQTAGIVF